MGPCKNRILYKNFLFEQLINDQFFSPDRKLEICFLGGLDQFSISHQECAKKTDTSRLQNSADKNIILLKLNKLYGFTFDAHAFYMFFELVFFPEYQALG